MVEGPSNAVNLVAPTGSTIPAPLVPALAAWLRVRSRRLPLWYALSMRLMPPRCLFCGQAADLGLLDLCSDCLESLPWATDAAGGAALEVMGETMIENSADIVLENALVPLRYADPVDGALRALKFQGDLGPARVFGALLAATAAVRSGRPELLVPVPLHPDRLHERGYNQAALIARAAGIWLGCPTAARMLERRRSTAPQTGLGAAARRQNVRAAFGRAPARAAAGRPGPVGLRRLALVDDVLTTGATMAAAAEPLRDLGQVSLWAVARPSSAFLTPEPGPPRATRDGPHGSGPVD